MNFEQSWPIFIVQAPSRLRVPSRQYGLSHLLWKLGMRSQQCATMIVEPDYEGEQCNVAVAECWVPDSGRFYRTVRGQISFADIVIGYEIKSGRTFDEIERVLRSAADADGTITITLCGVEKEDEDDLDLWGVIDDFRMASSCVKRARHDFRRRMMLQ